MSQRIARGMLGVSAAILLLGALVHTRAFPGTDAVATASNLPPFYVGALKALWLIDSTVLLVLAITFALFAAKPAIVVRPVALLLTLIPFGTAALLYKYLGAFIPAHMLMTAAVLAAVAIVLARRPESPSPG